MSPARRFARINELVTEAIAADHLMSDPAQPGEARDQATDAYVSAVDSILAELKALRATGDLAAVINFLNRRDR